jgi:RND family efflux transporter MFP subunit
MKDAAAMIKRLLSENFRRKSGKTIFIAGILILILLIAILAAAGRDSAEDGVDTDVQAKAVQVTEITESRNPVSLEYIGTVDAEELIRYSFKTAGQIKKIYVSEGEPVKAGEILAELDTTDLEYQQSASGDTKDTAAAVIQKAKDALDYANDLYIKAQSLYEDGAISKDYFDQIELKKNAAESDYQQALSQHAAAATDYAYKSDLLEDSVIYAGQDGYVAQKVAGELDRVGAYTPVLVVRSGMQVVNIGVPQQELAEVAIGSGATVDVDGEIAAGTVTRISELPDAATRTYNAEISVPDKAFRLGSIARVSIGIGNAAGIWIPLSSVFSDDGETCVYIVNGGRALRKTIEIQSIHEDQAMVSGLESGESLVISGMNHLDDGVLVKIQGQEQPDE